MARRPARLPESSAKSRRYHVDIGVPAQPLGASSRADRAQSGSRGQRAAAVGRSRRPLLHDRRLARTRARSVARPKPGRPGCRKTETRPACDPSLSSPVGAVDPSTVAASISPVRKAAIVLVSLDQSLASQLLTHLDRPAVEAVTWEIARLERVDPAERAAVLDEFYGLGLRRLCFVFDDLVKMNDADIRAALHEEDMETWALALAGGAAPARAKVLAALSGAVSRTAASISRKPGPVPAVGFGGGPARDRRAASPVVRPGAHQPAGIERERRGPRLRPGATTMAVADGSRARAKGSCRECRRSRRCRDRVDRAGHGVPVSV